MDLINTAANQAKAFVTGTFGDVLDEVQDSISVVRSAFGESWTAVKSGFKNASQKAYSSAVTFVDEHTLLVVGVGIAAAVSSPLWAPIVAPLASHMVKTIPRTVKHVIKTPLIALGVLRR